MAGKASFVEPVGVNGVRGTFSARIGRLLAVWLLYALLNTPVSADLPKLIERAFEKNIFSDLVADLRLSLINADGEIKQRDMQVYSKINTANELKMLLRLVEPAKVRDTAFLFIEHNDGEDDRRMFLPSLGRIHRISAADSKGHFMSSDFTYYDIGRPKKADWRYSTGDKTEQCTWILGEAISQRIIENTGYGWLEWCIDTARLIILKTNYYDRHGHHFKTLVADTIVEHGGEYFAQEQTMYNEESDAKSRVTFSNMRLNQGLADELFSNRSLRGRQ
ncbi:MAG: outer membrane lipoprotein-sorting protein [Gammaproteobacteria bacterium]